MSTFEDAITFALTHSTPSTGDNLLGFRIDLDYALVRRFDNVRVTSSDNPRCLINAICRAPDHLADPALVESMLMRIWLEELRYESFEAHEIAHGYKQVSLGFVTQAGKNLCVTGSITVILA